MKRIMTFAALLLAAASCQKDKFTQQDDYANNDKGMVFYATLDKNVDTKTTITAETGAGYKISWETTDEISVNGVRFVTDVIDPANPATATFKKASDETKADPTAPFKAYYPASIYDGTAATLPSTQSYNEDGNVADILPMYAESGDNNFKFTNLCGLLKFTLKGTEKVQNIILKDGTNALSGKFTVSDKAAVLDPSAEGGVKLDCGSEGVQLDETGKTFYVAVPAGTYDDLHLEFNTFGYAKYAKKTASATATVERNKVYPFEMTPIFKPNYFYFEAVEEGAKIGMTTYGPNPPAVNLSYSSDGESWNTFIVGTTVITLDKAGDKVYFKGDNTTCAILSESFHTFTADKKVNVGGNIMYLLNSEAPKTSLYDTQHCFTHLFWNMSNLISASQLKLPATTLGRLCYSNMFRQCSALKTAPELPATSLADYCYFYMFRGCSALKTAPELPATSLPEYCYYDMFRDCSALKTAPELPATSLAKSCYCEMFGGCSALETAPELPATSLASFCYESMFSGCSALKTAPELPATSLADNCYYYMFSGCSALKTAPELPATSLADNCYIGMFSNCSELEYVKCLANQECEDRNTSEWLIGVAPSGTFVKKRDFEWSEGESGIPEGWIVEEVE